MTLSAIQKTVRGLVATGILFLVTIIALGFLSYRLTDLQFWTIHTHQVIEQLDDSLAALDDVETGERGYCLNGAPIFLEPYNGGVENVKTHLAQVDLLTVDNPEQQTAAKLLNVIAKRRMELSERSIRSDRKDTSAFSDLQHRGKVTMDAFRQQIRVMVGNENRLLRKREAALATTRVAVWMITAALAVAVAILLVWVYRVTQKAIQLEKKRGDELSLEVEQRKRTERALKETTVNLVRSNADLQQFAYVASHDLQEPLRAITGFLTLLSGKKAASLDADAQRYINHAVEGAHRMRSLVNDLLAYARVESSIKPFEIVKLADVLDRVKLDLATSIEETGAIITSDKMPELPGDPTQLAQLFQNLIGNAIKFRGPQIPVIKIDVTEQKNEVLFAVHDNGRGFNMEHAERIFVIFQRLQGREEASGTGIGLALCKKIVDRHNGRIWVESKLGDGSTFFFTLSRLVGDTPRNGHT